MSMSTTTKNVTIKAFRFNTETDYLPYYKTYEMEVGKDELILDLLNRIKWEHDGSFSYRRSCRHGICGACGIKVNGKPVLSCKQNALELVELFGEDLVFEPQSQKRAVKDMIIDKGDFWEKHAAVKPYVEAKIDPHHPLPNIRREILKRRASACSCIGETGIDLSEDFHGLGECGLHFFLLGDVTTDRDRFSAQGQQCLFGGSVFLWVRSPYTDIGSRGGETLCHAQPNTAIAAGD